MNQQPSNSPSTPRKVALALQGGGSHGAFTWGVLDRLLEDETIEIIGVTGTSAGAMNAVALADGMVRGGPKLARAKLRQFWKAIGKMAGFNSILIWPMSGETVLIPCQAIPSEDAEAPGDRIDTNRPCTAVSAGRDVLCSPRPLHPIVADKLEDGVRRVDCSR
jgi:hypothetical protein